MYNEKNYVMTDAIRSNVTELMFRGRIDLVYDSKLIQKIYNDCEFLDERLQRLEEECNDWRKKYMKLKFQTRKVTEEEES